MADSASKKQKLDQRIEYDPLTVDGVTVRPVARLKGTRFTKAAEHAVGAGVVGTLQPEELIVDKGNKEYKISLRKSTGSKVRSTIIGGAAIALISIALCVLSSRVYKTVTR